MSDVIKVDLPEWFNEGSEPPQDKKSAGWETGERPAPAWFNWLFHHAYEALEDVQTNTLIIMAGEEEERPTPEEENRIYIATDTDKIWRDTGSDWTEVGITDHGNEYHTEDFQNASDVGQAIENHADKTTDVHGVEDGDIESTEGAQNKADTAESNANNYTDAHEAKDAPHDEHLDRRGDEMSGDLEMQGRNAVLLGDRFEVYYNDTDDSLEIEVV